MTQLNDKYFRNHLEECLAFGKPLLIENIGGAQMRALAAHLVSGCSEQELRQQPECLCGLEGGRPLEALHDSVRGA